MKTLLPGGLAVSAMLLPQTRREQEKLRVLAIPTASVRVVAFGANGRYLGVPDVSTFFGGEDRQDLAAKFRAGAAAGIPYGVYHVVGKMPEYRSDEEDVNIYEATVTVVLGLRFDSELMASLKLVGRVVGLGGAPDKTFAILASRTLTIPYTGPPLEIEVGADHVIGPK